MPDIQALSLKAVEMRLHITRMMEVGKPHHYGGSLSAADIVTALYFFIKCTTIPASGLARPRPLLDE